MRMTVKKQIKIQVVASESATGSEQGPELSTSLRPPGTEPGSQFPLCVTEKRVKRGSLKPFISFILCDSINLTDVEERALHQKSGKPDAHTCFFFVCVCV